MTEARKKERRMSEQAGNPSSANTTRANNFSTGSGLSNCYCSLHSPACSVAWYHVLVWQGSQTGSSAVFAR